MRVALRVVKLHRHEVRAHAAVVNAADLRLWAAMEAASEAGARLLAEFHEKPHLPALLVSVGPILVCWLLLLVTDGPKPHPGLPT